MYCTEPGNKNSGIMTRKESKTINDRPIRKILVPVDYSECSELACRYAAKLACKLDAEVKLFHAYFTPSFDLIELSGTVQIQEHLKEEVASDLEATEKKTAEKFVQDLQDAFSECRAANIVVTYGISAGVPEDEIARYCDEYLPDLVIMGTHGRDSGKSILGSVTESMIRRLKCPVLAIPEKYSFVGEKNLKNLMYVTEFDESDFVSIKKLMDLMSSLNMKIHCLHIGEETGEWDKIKMEGLKEYFKKAYKKSEVECSFVGGIDLIDAINLYVQEKNVNIISLTSRRRNIIDKLFRTDLTKKLFYHSNIPLLVFHA